MIQDNRAVLPEASIKKSGISIIWIIPVIAVLIGCWMVYRDYAERGVEVTLTFNSGEGIVAEKTLLKYEGVEVGMVHAVRLNSKNNKITVSATLEKSAAHLARKGSDFWLVKPRLGVDGVSGLETIVTGQYIRIRPGKGEASFQFTALDNPPPTAPDAPGLHVTLTSDDLGSIEDGSPVLFRKIRVGRVESHALSDDNKSVLIHLYFFEQYASLVRQNTRFWNVSGVSISGDLSGIKIKTDSITSLLSGGISFDTPDFEEPGPPSENGAAYPLHEDRESAMEKGFLVKIVFDTGEGIVPGTTPVKYKGLAIGKVTDVNVIKDGTKIEVSVLLDERTKPGITEGTLFWMVRPRLDANGISGLSTLISGQYIEVKPGTGKIPAFYFKGLPARPFSDPDAPGLHIVLRSDQLDYLYEGAPIHFHGIEAGEVEGHQLTKDGVDISIHIYEKFASLVYDTTRFWNTSGISVTGGLSGIEVKTGTLESLFTGALSFETYFNEKKGRPAANGAIFTIYKDQESARERGNGITITFKNGDGLKAGFTEIKYQGLTVGRVKEVIFNKYMDGVVVTATLNESASELAREGSRFWVVRPRADLGGISGLNTMIQGEFIEVTRGDGNYKSTFEGDESPVWDIPGLRLTLTARNPAPIEAGTPVLFRGVEVGKIVATRLAQDGKGVRFNAVIYEKQAHLVRKNSRFWNMTGIHIKAELSGVTIDTASLAQIMTGGIGLETPVEDPGEPCKNPDVFPLFESYDKAMEKGFPITIAFKNGSGLTANHTPLFYRGINVGEVREVTLSKDLDEVLVTAFITESARALIREKSRFKLAGPAIGVNGVKNLDALISGPYIEVIPGEGRPSLLFSGESPESRKELSGVTFNLKADGLSSLSAGKPVYYRQIQVGEITGYHLAETADHVVIQITIDQKYAPIVRKNSRFWYTGGLGTSISLTGIKMKTESLEALLSGGIAFATPNEKNMGLPATESDMFYLSDAPKPKWLKWKPQIRLSADPVSRQIAAGKLM